ncbi:MAG: hypothetical protein ACI4EI_10595 [Muricoprocola sp.]
MDINSSTEEINLHLFSLLRRTIEWKDHKKLSETNVVQGKLVMNQSNYESRWDGIELRLTQQEYDFLYLLALGYILLSKLVGRYAAADVHLF